MMKKIMYGAIVAFLFATGMAAQAQLALSPQNLYDAWRHEALLSLTDARHFYLSATVMALQGNEAMLRFGVGGTMSGYSVKVQAARLVSSESGPSMCFPIGDERTITNPYTGFADLSASVPAGGQINAVILSLQPIGSFDDSRSLRIFLPTTQAQPTSMMETAALATTVRCPAGCFLWSATFPPPCKPGVQYVCCKTNHFDVDPSRCALKCINSDPCAVIVDTTATGVGIGTVK